MSNPTPSAKSPTRIAVSDAGPLIHLSQLNCLDLFSAFASVLVPKAVEKEVHKFAPTVVIQAPLESCSAPVPPGPGALSTCRIFSLDEGEAQCLAVLEQKPGAMFLTDDAAARMAGRQIGVEVHGSIGILALSIRRGQRTAQQILQLLDELPKRSTLYVTQALLDRVKERIRREFGIKL